MISIFDTFRGGVSGQSFIGRREYLKKLTQYSQAEECKHISIYGLPHIGKTSILLEWQRIIKEKEVDKKLNVVYINVPLSRGYVGFLQELLVRTVSPWRKPENNIGIIEDVKEYIAIVNSTKDSRTLLSMLKDIICKLSNKGIRTVLLIDEFERIRYVSADSGIPFSEDDYYSFVKLLVDESIDVFCVVASRPHISYILRDYETQMIPFIPLLIEPFSDNDMDEYLDIVCDYRNKFGHSISTDFRKDKEALRDVIFYCGKTPYLLNKFSATYVKSEEESVKEIYEKRQGDFRRHYYDVANFMLSEEENSLKSFTHIIKCYFGTSKDYIDIIENYIRLGYIEASEVGSKYAYEDSRYVYHNESNNKDYYYYTVCPAFRAYLIINYIDSVKDTRDLLTGFVYELRDITMKELKKKYGDDWNVELLKRFKAGTKFADYVVDEETNILGWYSVKRDDLSFDRKSWVEAHSGEGGETIQVSGASLNFAAMEINLNHNNVMPVLDAINLVDNYTILKKNKDLFDSYLKFEEPVSYKEIGQQFADVQDVRNKLSHFSRYGMDESKYEEAAEICRKYIRKFYNYQTEGKLKELKDKP